MSSGIGDLRVFVAAGIGLAFLTGAALALIAASLRDQRSFDFTPDPEEPRP